MCATCSTPACASSARPTATRPPASATCPSPCTPPAAAAPPPTTCSTRARWRRSSGGLLRDDADLAARLEDRPLDVLEVRHLVLARRLGDLLDRQSLPLEVPLDHLPVLDDDQRLAVEDGT